MWRGVRSSRRFTGNGGCRGIIKVQNGAARCRRRGVMDLIHAAFVQGLGHITPSQDHTPSPACEVIVEAAGGSTEVSIGGQEPPQRGSHGVAQALMTAGGDLSSKREAGSSIFGMASMSCLTPMRYSVSPFRRSSK